MEALTIHRFQFAFTVTYHYLFPQLTMGLALLIFVLKTMALRGDPVANHAVRFWAKIFGVTFVMGVITGIPLEFQFGTNWSRFAQAAGGVIGQTLAMEGVFAFFLESSFLYLLLFGEHRLGQRGHWVAALLVFVGTWLSGFFIVCTNAWMQHPVGYEVAADGVIRLTSLSALFTNPWALPQYLHVMVGTTITASFVMAAIGAFYLLRREHVPTARRFLSVAVVVGLIASVVAAFPTGDLQSKLVYKHQPVTFAAMEGHFHTEDGAGLVLIGQPNVRELRLDNPIILPRMLSFLTHQRWEARIVGLNDFERRRWPDNIELLYYAYHVMAGLGTFFIAITTLSAFFLWRKRLHEQRWLLWVLMLALPFPFIANTAGWMTAELGRQPWLIYGLMRTADGHSTNVSGGNALFTLIGFMGMYVLLSVLYFFITTRIIAHGPEPVSGGIEPNSGGA
ncbi:MAG: cytochrome ubiquinol oxidase subunit I [Candidatus Methylomirabilis sp.]